MDTSSTTAVGNPADPVLEMIDADIPDSWRTDQVAVERVNWRVMPGEFWFVGGLHHSGKSDILSVAGGIVPPQRGKCQLFGADATMRGGDDFLRVGLRVGMVFDGGRLLHHLTLAENVALPVAYHNNLPLYDAIKQVQPLMELAEVLDEQDSYPSDVSRSWQQRAGLARALAHGPDLLLADSPLSGLDPLDARWWVTVLSRLRDGDTVVGKKLTVVVTGDALQPWRERADRYAILKDTQLNILAAAPGQNPQEQPLLNHLLPAELASL